jgi:hypothetical protein
VKTPSTHYLSLVTSASREASLLGIPFLKMNFLLRGAAAYQEERSDFASAPIPGWGGGDLTMDKWRENDGAVSSISQRYPFAGAARPFGGEGIFAQAGRIEKGKWYFERLDQMLGGPVDHLDVVFGASMLLNWRPWHHVPYETIYQKLDSLFQTLP